MRFLSVLLFAIAIMTPFHSVSQNYKNKEVTLISFSINIHPDTKKYFDQFENLFIPVKNIKADRIIAKLKEQTWSSLVDSLQQEIGMVILPISTFGSKISYDDFNFPDVSISKAQRIGFSKFYIKIDMEIGPEVLQYPLSHKAKNDTTIKKQKPKEGEIKPVVTITITCFPANGIVPIGKYVGSAQASTIWNNGNSSILDGLINTNIKTDLSTLMSIVNEAIFDATIDMQIK